MKSLYQTIMMLVMMTVVCGIVYPLLVHVLAQTVLSHKADGSLITKNGVIVGSELIAQKFSDAKFFWPRPSAGDYQAVPSQASNLGPTSLSLKNALEKRQQIFAKTHGIKLSEVPEDMITTSASGLDPHISLTSALVQAERVAKARRYTSKQKEKLIELLQTHADMEKLATFDEKIVNVQKVNMNLDKINYDRQ